MPQKFDSKEWLKCATDFVAHGNSTRKHRLLGVFWWNNLLWFLLLATFFANCL